MDAAQKLEMTTYKNEQQDKSFDSFTHGSSEQRMHWFQVGLKPVILTNAILLIILSKFINKMSLQGV